MFDGDRKNDALLTIEDGTDRVVKAWPIRPELLTDFLNDMDNLENYGESGIDVSQLNPTNWGDLVIARSEDGDVLSVNPQLYWEGLAGWYRSVGRDPHNWSESHH
jgi:hypothetical protein